MPHKRHSDSGRGNRDHSSGQRNRGGSEFVRPPPSNPFVLLPFVPGGNNKPPSIRQPANIPPQILQRLPLSDIISIVAMINDNVRHGFSHLDKKRYRLRSRGAALAIILELILCIAVGVGAYFIAQTLAMQWVAYMFGGVIIIGSLWPGIRAARNHAENRRIEHGVVKDDWLYPLLDHNCERLNQRYEGAGVVFFCPREDPLFSRNGPGGKKIGVDSPFFRAFIVLQCDNNRISAPASQCSSPVTAMGVPPGMPVYQPLMAPEAPPVPMQLQPPPSSPVPTAPPLPVDSRQTAGRIAAQRKSRPPTGAQHQRQHHSHGHSRQLAPASQPAVAPAIPPQPVSSQPVATPFMRPQYSATLTAVSTIVDYGIPQQQLAAGSQPMRPVQSVPFVAEGVRPAPFSFMQEETSNPQLQSAMMLF